MNTLRSPRRAFSLVELLITVGVIAVLSAVALPVFTGWTESAAANVARRNLNFLNGAVVAFNNAKSEIDQASAADASDELAVFTLLQTADPDAKGSPFLSTNLRCITTSSEDTYRASWNGRFFQMLAPGAAGSGVDLQAMAGSVESPP
jgi:prepilin-type N-terminal cleavage/methylation domain-containing protein